MTTDGSAVAVPQGTGRVRPLRSETRRRVLDAAFEVFAERGIAVSSLSDVAAAAGLTKGAVYSNFAGKDDLVLALMEERVSHRLAAALDSFAEAEFGPEALTSVAATLVREMHSDAAWHRLLAEYFALSRHDDRLREALRRRRREARDAIARALTRLADSGGFELPLPADQLAVVFLALSNGFAVEADIDAGAVPDDLLGRVFGLIAGDALARAGTATPRRRRSG